MAANEKIISGAFLICVALTACGDRADREYAQAPADTVMQPGNMPAPANPAPEVASAMQGKDSRATEPLKPSTPTKENSTMPEALQGNNHSSPSVGTTSQPDTSGALKKSSLMMTKSPKVIWV